jgi:hypothetical protein
MISQSNNDDITGIVEDIVDEKIAQIDILTPDYVESRIDEITKASGVFDPKILDDVRAAGAHTYEPTVSVDVQVIALRHMDNIIRSINDEENGVFDDWITRHVPDRASDDELRDLCETDPMLYPDACEFFARLLEQ